MFIQTKKNRVFEDIIFQIEEAILQGTFKTGDRLPGERQLRETFKVSRGTLREALRALEQKRLIQVKTGVKGGVFACEVDTQQVTESLDTLLRYQKISLEELSEFRETVEPLVAIKGIKKAKDEDLRQLGFFLESIKNHLNSGELRWDKIMKEDKNFHLYLAQISGNRVFESVLKTIYANINRYYERFLSKDLWILEKTYRDLSYILKAIKKRDSNKAVTLLKNHIKRFDRLMEERNKPSL